VKVTLSWLERRRFESEAEHWPVEAVVQEPDAPVDVEMLTTTPDWGVPAPLSTVAVMVARQRVELVIVPTPVRLVSRGPAGGGGGGGEVGRERG
jgi:hypothetical protein